MVLGGIWWHTWDLFGTILVPRPVLHRITVDFRVYLVSIFGSDMERKSIKGDTFFFDHIYVCIVALNLVVFGSTFRIIFIILRMIHTRFNVQFVIFNYWNLIAIN